VTADPVRVAVVGAGAMGRWHAAAARRAGSVVVAAVDTDRARAEALGAEAAFTRVDEALQETRPDVVHVCTPVGAHAEAVTLAFASGAHAVVEKPVAPDAEATERLLEEAERQGRLLVPVHQFLFQAGVRRTLAGLHELGELVDLSFDAASAGAELAGLDPDELVAEILPHPLALFERLRPGSTGGDWQVVRPAPGELHAVSSTGGAAVRMSLSAAARPTRNALTISGTHGTAHADLYHGFAVVERGGVSRRRKAQRPFSLGTATIAAAGANLLVRATRRQYAYPGLAELVAASHETVRTGGTSPISPAETLAVARARDTVLAAPRAR